MAHYELDEDQRMRVQHALAKDEADLKRLKKSNADEGLDVRDIDAKLRLLRGEKGGKPGLIQIFSNQTEIFAEPGSDNAQLSIDDALEGEGDGTRWAEWVPKPRPEKGDYVSTIAGGLARVTDTLGFIYPGSDGQHPPTEDQIAAGLDGKFGVFVVSEAVFIANASGTKYSPDDKEKIYIVSEPNGEGFLWQQVEAPPIDVSEIKEAVQVGIERGEGNEEGSDVETKPRRRRASAGNLAGAVRKEVARATGDRKIDARKPRKKT